jgi:hypothetical protein
MHSLPSYQMQMSSWLWITFLPTEITYKRMSLKCPFRREQIIGIDPRYILVPRDAAMDVLPITHTGLSSQLGMLYHIYAFRSDTC